MSERAEAEACQGPTLNPVVTEAIEGLMKAMPPAITHGVFNRYMFLEAVVVKGGGAALDEEDIRKHCGCTSKEFTIIKDEYIAKGVLKEETNLFGVTLYSLQYDTKGGGLDNLPEIK
ncbi:hypothetical protein LCGC14_0207950 [marine sediment metagenome]|uniref:Uncharacterized protein n=1 Tax=marine sediment metagenome TaxID=412755 RepID=A0A0F9UKZ9_9ZZZZ